MRGDSLRDLYAKALAVAGLVALAGVGALVDYWPTAPELPRLTVAALPRLLPAGPRAADVQLAIAPPDVIPRATVALLSDNVSPDSVSVDEIIDRVGDTEVVVATDEPAGEAPPPVNLDVNFDVRPIAVVALFATPIELSAPPPLQLPPTRALIAAPSSGGITGGFRRTGSLIVTAGVKTGSTIVSAFRAFGGALKKIL